MNIICIIVVTILYALVLSINAIINATSQTQAIF